MQRVCSFSNQSPLYHHPLWIPTPLPWCSLSISQPACISLSTPPIGVRAELDNKLFELMLIFSHPQRLWRMGGTADGIHWPRWFVRLGDKWKCHGVPAVSEGDKSPLNDGCHVLEEDIGFNVAWTWNGGWRATAPSRLSEHDSRRVVCWMWDNSLRNGHEIEIRHRAQLFIRWKGSLLRYCYRKNFISA